jgi:hypothetical protein
MNQEELLKSLEKQTSYLSNTFKIPGMEPADVKQELILMVLENYEKNADPKYGSGWWFKRMQWHLRNLRIKASKEPVNRSMRIERLS